LPAMIITDAVTRLVPGVLGGETSAEEESYSKAGEIEHPHYTKPEEYRGLRVPAVLLSGHHAEIAKWRKENTR
jgi:tRNA (guanine37-N1)-methyltransferase